jgi:hypothetical protein
MMADTILLVFLVFGLVLFLLYVLIKFRRIPTRKFLIVTSAFLVAILTLFLLIGSKKLNADISRIIHNSTPKSPTAIYNLLFKKPLDSCVSIINIKDQVVPQVDCCIWLEVKVCPNEVKRIANLQKYEKSIYHYSDSVKFLKTFADRPNWWQPQNLGDSLIKLNIKFDQDNQQSIFFASDSSRLFICDQAL